MTLLVHRKIKKFRLANNMSQKKLAAAIGISNSNLSCIESGLIYPQTRHIAKLNELGANIRPSVFSRFAHLITMTVNKKNHAKAYFKGVPITENQRFWIKAQLQKKGINNNYVAVKAGYSLPAVYDVLSGRRRTRKVQATIAAVLGYGSFEELLEACRQRKGGAE
jgi:transcriptional regulator with XRE-family HTH domain